MEMKSLTVLLCELGKKFPYPLAVVKSRPEYAGEDN